MSDQAHPDELPPAYFLSLSLENVRCFGSEQTLDLTDEKGNPAQWTVLLGDNGTGKTTLLQAIVGMEPRLGKSGANDSQSILTRSFERGGLGKMFQIPREPKVSVSAELCFGDDIHEVNVDERRNSFRLEAGYYNTAYYGPKKDFSGSDNFFCVGYGAGREMATGAFEEKDKSGVESLFDEEMELPNAEEWLLQTDYAAKSGKEKAHRRLKQIKTVLSHPDSGILPDVDDLHFAEQDGETSPPRVEFHTPYGWVTIDQLSLGYRTMIAWVVDLARRLFKRYPESDNPLAEPAVCLVDEIDLHLHPKWQRKIIDFLSDRFPNTQFIVTAHSPLVVQAAHDANIALLKRVEVDDGDDYVQIHNDMEPVGNLRVDQILTSDLYGLESARPPDLDELLEERRDILAKSELTDEDEARLDEIEERVGDVPAGETKEQREAMAFIKDVADRLDEDE
jgi:ABC-type multidrug transport system ATPase subunit